MFGLNGITAASIPSKRACLQQLSQGDPLLGVVKLPPWRRKAAPKALDLRRLDHVFRV